MRSPAIFVQSVCCPCPQLYSSLPLTCRGGFTPPSWVPLLCDLCVLSALSVNSSLSLLLSVRCYLLSPLPPQPTNLLATHKKRRKLSLPPSITSKFAVLHPFVLRTAS